MSPPGAIIVTFNVRKMILLLLTLVCFPDSANATKRSPDWQSPFYCIERHGEYLIVVMRDGCMLSSFELWDVERNYGPYEIPAVLKPTIQHSKMIARSRGGAIGIIRVDDKRIAEAAEIALVVRNRYGAAYEDQWVSPQLSSAVTLRESRILPQVLGGYVLIWLIAGAFASGRMHTRQSGPVL